MAEEQGKPIKRLIPLRPVPQYPEACRCSPYKLEKPLFHLHWQNPFHSHRMIPMVPSVALPWLSRAAWTAVSSEWVEGISGNGVGNGINDENDA
jgi:hypothetical protein